MPEQLVVVGHDDSPIATLFVPALSSERVDTTTLRCRFADFALHHAAGRPSPARDQGARIVPSVGVRSSLR